MAIKQNINKNKEDDYDLAAKGCWKTGDHTFINIAEIEDEIHIKKLVSIVQKREKQAIQRLIGYLGLQGLHYRSLCKRATELNLVISLQFQPLLYTLDSENLKKLRTEIDEYINKAETNN